VIDPTHCPLWAESLAETQKSFVAELETRGFSPMQSEGKWEGQLEVVGLSGMPTTVDLEIWIPDAFPFEPPKVTDVSMLSAHTWHHDPDWGLCLYGRRNVADRPWQDVDQLFSRIQAWFQNAADGWPADPPDLDVERYFPQVDMFVTYSDITEFLHRPVSAAVRRENWLHIDRVGSLPSNKRFGRRGTRRRRRWGWVGDIGELDKPVHSWSSVRALLGPHATGVEKRIRAGAYEFLALRYQRQGHQGVLVLFLAVQHSEIQLHAASSAADDDDTRRMRAGNPRTVRALRRSTVAIVGVGAVGSFLADLLARAGIGSLHLVDDDVLRPGNCIRHLAGYGHIGSPKTTAVQEVITNSKLMTAGRARQTTKKLDPALAAELLEQSDVVVDATADDNVRGLLVHLHDVARANNIPSSVVTVAVHRSGGVIRSDRWPRHDQQAPSPIPAHPDGELELRESGCGDPVSTTPAAAVMEAAGLASRHVIDLLTGDLALPDSIVQVRIPQPDVPYQAVGTVT